MFFLGQFEILQCYKMELCRDQRCGSFSEHPMSFASSLSTAFFLIKHFWKGPRSIWPQRTPLNRCRYFWIEPLAGNFMPLIYLGQTPHVMWMFFFGFFAPISEIHPLFFVGWISWIPNVLLKQNSHWLRLKPRHGWLVASRLSIPWVNPQKKPNTTRRYFWKGALPVIVLWI